MRRATLAAAALALALVMPSLAQQQTRTYDYEWIHLRFNTHLPGADVVGWLFMEDVAGVRSRFQGSLRTPDAGQIFVCVGNTAEGIPLPGDADIVQVGPFAQQGSGNIASALPTLQSTCPQLQSLTVSCPYQGVPAPQARGYTTFTHSGTYRDDDGITGSYSISSGHHGPIQCEVEVNGVHQGQFSGWLARFQETRRGESVAPVPLWWQEPLRWTPLADFFSFA
jgi:hypothetical protein